METGKLVSIIMVLIVLSVLVIGLFYVLGSPLKEKLTNLKCDYLGLECKEIPKVSEEEKQKIKQANEKNLVNAIAYQYENCGKNKKEKCKCTLTFSMTDKAIIFVEKDNKIKILTSAENQKSVNVNNLLLDDLFSYGHKPIDVKKVIIEKKETMLWTSALTPYDHKIEITYDEKTKRYGGPSIGYINDVLNSFGILKDENGNKMIYIPEGMSDIELVRRSFEDKTDIPKC